MTAKLKSQLIKILAAVCLLFLFAATPTYAWYSDIPNKYVSIEYSVGSKSTFSMVYDTSAAGTISLGNQEKNLIATMPTTEPIAKYTDAPTATALSPEDWVHNCFGANQLIQNRDNTVAVVLSGKLAANSVANKYVGVRVNVTPRSTDHLDYPEIADRANKAAAEAVRYAVFYGNSENNETNLIANNDYHYGSGRYFAIQKQGSFEYTVGADIYITAVIWLDSVSDAIAQQGVFDVEIIVADHSEYIVPQSSISFSTTDSSPRVNISGFLTTNTTVTDLHLPDMLYRSNVAFTTYRITNSAFAQDSLLKTVVIPDTIISLGTNTFKNCTNLETVVIGNNVRQIDYGTFAGCTNLKKIIFRNPYGWYCGSSVNAGVSLNLNDPEYNAEIAQLTTAPGNAGSGTSTTWRRNTAWVPSTSDNVTITRISPPIASSIFLRNADDFAGYTATAVGVVDYGMVNCELTNLTWTDGTPTTIGSFEAQGTVVAPVGFAFAQGVETTITFNINTTAIYINNTEKFTDSTTVGANYTLPQTIKGLYAGGSVDLDVTWYDELDNEVTLVDTTTEGVKQYSGVINFTPEYTGAATLRASATINVNEIEALGHWEYSAYDTNWTQATLNQDGTIPANESLFTVSSISGVTVEAVANGAGLDSSTARTKGFISVGANKQAVRVVVPTGFVGTLTVEAAPLDDTKTATLSFNGTELNTSASTTSTNTAPTTGTDGGSYNDQSSVLSFAINGGGTYYLSTTLASDTAYLSYIALTGYVNVSRIISSVTAPQSFDSIYLIDVANALSSYTADYVGVTQAGVGVGGVSIPLGLNGLTWRDGQPTSVGTHYVSATLTAPNGYVFADGINTNVTFPVDVVKIRITDITIPNNLTIPFTDVDFIDELELSCSVTAEDGTTFEGLVVYNIGWASGTSPTDSGTFDVLGTISTPNSGYEFLVDGSGAEAKDISFTIQVTDTIITSFETVTYNKNLGESQALPTSINAYYDGGSITINVTWKDNYLNDVTQVSSAVPAILTYSALYDLPLGYAVSNNIEPSATVNYICAVDHVVDITETIAYGVSYTLPSAAPVYYGAGETEYLTLPITWYDTNNTLDDTTDDTLLDSNVVDTSISGTQSFYATINSTVLYSDEEDYQIVATITIEQQTSVSASWILPAFGKAWNNPTGSTVETGNITSDYLLASGGGIAITAKANKASVDTDAAAHPHTNGFIKIGAAVSDAIEIVIPAGFVGSVEIGAESFSDGASRSFTFNNESKSVTGGKTTNVTNGTYLSEYDYTEGIISWEISTDTGGTFYISTTGSGSKYISHITVSGTADAPPTIDNLTAPENMSISFGLVGDISTMLPLNATATNEESETVSVPITSIVWADGTPTTLGSFNANLTLAAPSGYTFSDGESTATIIAPITVVATEITNYTISNGITIPFTDISNVANLNISSTLTAEYGANQTTTLINIAWVSTPTTVDEYEATATLTAPTGYVFSTALGGGTSKSITFNITTTALEVTNLTATLPESAEIGSTCTLPTTAQGMVDGENVTVNISWSNIIDTSTVGTKTSTASISTVGYITSETLTASVIVYANIVSFVEVTDTTTLNATYSLQTEFPTVTANYNIVGGGSETTTLNVTWSSGIDTSTVGVKTATGIVSGTTYYIIGQEEGDDTATAEITVTAGVGAVDNLVFEYEIYQTASLPQTITALDSANNEITLTASWKDSSDNSVANNDITSTTVSVKTYTATLTAPDDNYILTTTSITATVTNFAKFDTVETFSTISVPYLGGEQLPTPVTFSKVYGSGESAVTVSQAMAVTYTPNDSAETVTSVDTSSIGAKSYIGTPTTDSLYRVENGLTALAQYKVYCDILSVVPPVLPDQVMNASYTLPNTVNVNYGTGETMQTATVSAQWNSVASTTTPGSYTFTVTPTITDYVKNPSSLTTESTLVVYAVITGYTAFADASVNVNETYTLPTQIQVQYNGGSTTLSVSWSIDGTTVTTYTPTDGGNFTFSGTFGTNIYRNETPIVAQLVLVANASSAQTLTFNWTHSTSINESWIDVAGLPTTGIGVVKTQNGITLETLSSCSADGAQDNKQFIKISKNKSNVVSITVPSTATSTVITIKYCAYSTSKNGSLTITSATDSSITANISTGSSTTTNTGDSLVNPVTVDLLLNADCGGVFYLSTTGSADNIYVTNVIVNATIPGSGSSDTTVDTVTAPTGTTINYFERLGIGSVEANAVVDVEGEASQTIQLTNIVWKNGTPTALGNSTAQGTLRLPDGYVFDNGESTQTVDFTVEVTGTTVGTVTAPTNCEIEFANVSNISSITANATVAVEGQTSLTIPLTGVGWENDVTPTATGTATAVGTLTLPTGYLFSNNGTTQSVSFSVSVLSNIVTGEISLTPSNPSISYIDKTDINNLALTGSISDTEYGNITLTILSIAWTNGTPTSATTSQATVTVLLPNGYCFTGGATTKTTTIDVEVTASALTVTSIPTNLELLYINKDSVSDINPTIVATDLNGDTLNLSVSGIEWQSEPTAVGNNTAQGTLVIPSGYTIASTSITFNVNLASVNISSINEISATVSQGATYTAPTTVVANYLVGQTEHSITLGIGSWTPAISTDVAGNFEHNATITLITGVTNTDSVKAVLNLSVQAQTVIERVVLSCDAYGNSSGTKTATYQVGGVTQTLTVLLGGSGSGSSKITHTDGSEFTKARKLGTSGTSITITENATLKLYVYGDGATTITVDNIAYTPSASGLVIQFNATGNTTYQITCSSSGRVCFQAVKVYS